MANKLTVGKSQVEAWLSKLPNFDKEDPKPGHYQVFLCPETGAVFHSREETRAYTKKTQITDFVLIWVTVQNDGSGNGWKLANFSSNKPSAQEVKDMKTKTDEFEQRKKDKIKKEQEEELQRQLEEQREREARELAESEANTLEKQKREDERRRQQEAEKKKKEEELKEKLQSGGAREAVSKIGSKSVDDRSSLVSTEDNAYGKWVNDKLTRGGHSPIRIDKMLKEFYDGTVLRKLLSVLTKGQQEDTLKLVSMRPYNKFVVSNNYKVLWDLMTGPEGINLGGINSVSIWGSHPNQKVLIALIRKLQQHYDFIGGRSALLEWVQPRTEKYKHVDNFTRDWSSGVAFLALYDSIFPGKVDPINDQDPEANLKKAFTKFSEDLGVVPLLEPKDLLGDDIDEELVMMYVSSIRNAIVEYTSSTTYTSSAIDEGEDLFAKANALRARYTAETKQHMEDILKETAWQFDRIAINEEHEVDKLIADAAHTLYDPAETKFDEVHGLYLEAIEKFQTVEGNTSQPRIDEITEAIKSSDKVPVDYRQDLINELEKMKNNWRKNALLREGKHVVNVTEEELSSYLEVIHDYIDSELPNCNSEADRITLKKTVIDMVDNKGGPGVNIAIGYYDDAKNLCEDIQDKTAVDVYITEANDMLNKYRNEVSDYLFQRFSEKQADKEQSQEDILQMYHQFSLQCAESIRELMPYGQCEVGEEEINRRKGAAADRLEQLLEVVKKSYERDCLVRREIHVGVDALFDQETLPL